MVSRAGERGASVWPAGRLWRQALASGAGATAPAQRQPQACVQRQPAVCMQRQRQLPASLAWLDRPPMNRVVFVGSRSEGWGACCRDAKGIGQRARSAPAGCRRLGRQHSWLRACHSSALGLARPACPLRPHMLLARLACHPVRRGMDSSSGRGGERQDRQSNPGLQPRVAAFRPPLLPLASVQAFCGELCRTQLHAAAAIMFTSPAAPAPRR